MNRDEGTYSLSDLWTGLMHNTTSWTLVLKIASVGSRNVNVRYEIHELVLY